MGKSGQAQDYPKLLSGDGNVFSTSEEPMSDEVLREMCDKNYHQLLSLIAEKMQKEKEHKDKLNAVKARLIYGEESGIKIRSREESHYS
ncbi:hypothetical protein Tco_1372935, partial [Tanacetum coccineum]